MLLATFRLLKRTFGKLSERVGRKAIGLSMLLLQVLGIPRLIVYMVLYRSVF